MNNPVQNGHNRWLGALAILLALTFWEFYAAFIVRDSFLLPGPADVLVAFIALLNKGILLADLEVSFIHFGIGLAAALLVGIPIGIAMGWSRRLDAFLDPVVELLRPIPPLAWIPFAIIWFGFTPYSAGFVIFAGAVFPILINTYSGFRSVPKIFVEAGKMLGCTKNRDLIRYIAFPAALPSVVAGIRIATGVGWMCLVAAESLRCLQLRAGQKPLALLRPPPDGQRRRVHDPPWPHRPSRRYGVQVLHRPPFPEVAHRGGGVRWAISRSGT